MRHSTTALTGALGLALMLGAAPAEARHHRYHNDHARHHDQRCLRFDKTTGTVAGAVGGGVLGSLIGGHGNHTAGTFIGAAAGGLAGHELAKNGRKHC